MRDRRRALAQTGRTITLEQPLGPAPVLALLFQAGARDVVRPR